MTTHTDPPILVEPRHVQAEFLARGSRSRDEARRTNGYVDAELVLDKLQIKLDAVRERIAKTRVAARTSQPAEP